MLLQIVGYALQFFAAWGIHQSSKRVRQLSEIAGYAWTLAVVDVLRLPLELTRPHKGVLFLVDQLSFLVIPMLLGLLSIKTLMGRLPTCMPTVYALTALMIIGAHPSSAAYSVYDVVIASTVLMGWSAVVYELAMGRLNLVTMTLAAYLSGWFIVLLGGYTRIWGKAVPVFFIVNLLLVILHTCWRSKRACPFRQASPG
jgi:hypothetical protein